MTWQEQVAHILAALPDNAQLQCSACGLQSASETGAGGVIEHAAYAHAARADVLMVEVTTLLSSNELGVVLGLEPRTEVERRWRETAAAQALR